MATLFLSKLGISTVPDSNRLKNLYWTSWTNCEGELEPVLTKRQEQPNTREMTDGSTSCVQEVTTLVFSDISHINLAKGTTDQDRTQDDPSFAFLSSIHPSSLTRKLV
ncbi:Hypothetical protein NTJ_14152 [Nesidiocoris tenuis]|uniref:Uncharacterized protein n=1 Tax=Nesidiocoris tenuis TaxID=355587 RepID=A0ABN7BAD1_9HEMI|nr:Hypothetical protein NTJ_14152 [Nesidiocoris tenuis]